MQPQHRRKQERGSEPPGQERQGGTAKNGEKSTPNAKVDKGKVSGQVKKTKAQQLQNSGPARIPHNIMCLISSLKGSLFYALCLHLLQTLYHTQNLNLALKNTKTKPKNPL